MPGEHSKYRVNTRFTPTYHRKPLVGANLVFVQILDSTLFSCFKTACKVHPYMQPWTGVRGKKNGAF